MNGAVSSQLVVFALVVVLIGFVLQRRMRPQPVRTNQLAGRTGVIVVIIALSLLASGGRILSDPLALVLTPVFLVLGVLIGFILVRTMTFWNDGQTGQLWMRGGFMFAFLLLVTVVVRFGFRYLASGGKFATSAQSQPHGFLYDLSADFLLLSLGLWLARAGLIYVRAERPDVWQRLPWLGSMPSGPARTN